MRVLGIDPGTLCAGYAIIEYDRKRTLLVESSTLKMPRTEPLPKRLFRLYTFFDSLLSDSSIDRISLETPFCGKNMQTFLKLGYVRGIIYLLAQKHQVSLVEYAPVIIKRALTRNTRATKEQVSDCIHQLFPGLAIGKDYDSTDAIAIALTGAWRTPHD